MKELVAAGREGAAAFEFVDERALLIERAVAEGDGGPKGGREAGEVVDVEVQQVVFGGVAKRLVGACVGFARFGEKGAPFELSVRELALGGDGVAVRLARGAPAFLPARDVGFVDAVHEAVDE